MKDFEFRNDTRLLFRNDPVPDLARLMSGKKVLFVYGGGSVKKDGCYDDISSAAKEGHAELFELGGASRDLSDINRGIEAARSHGIELVIGAGGASIMDCSKFIAFGAFHESDLWDYIDGKKNPYGGERIPLVLMPTYPSSGSEYGLGAVATDRSTGRFGTAYGIPADIALLVPKYSMSLGPEMTSYSALVTLVQLCAAVIGDRNRVSYDIGIAVIRDILDAARVLKEHPDDADARGAILYGAALSTSSRLGLGKADNYAYEIYDLEFIPEELFGVPYRRSLTTIFPRFLLAVSEGHEDDVMSFIDDAFGYDGPIEDSVDEMVRLFEDLGADMHLDGRFDEAAVRKVCVPGISIPVDRQVAMIRACMRSE